MKDRRFGAARPNGLRRIGDRVVRIGCSGGRTECPFRLGPYAADCDSEQRESGRDRDLVRRRTGRVGGNHTQRGPRACRALSGRSAAVKVRAVRQISDDQQSDRADTVSPEWLVEIPRRKLGFSRGDWSGVPGNLGASTVMGCSWRRDRRKVDIDVPEHMVGCFPSSGETVGLASASWPSAFPVSRISSESWSPSNLVRALVGGDNSPAKEAA